MKGVRTRIFGPALALASLVFVGREVPAAEPVNAVVVTQTGSVRGQSDSGLLTFKGVPIAARKRASHSASTN